MNNSHNLDVLRALAVTAVFLAHATHTAAGPSHPYYDVVEAIARFGVIIFFVHTSLVLMLSMRRTQKEPAFVRRFYVRRAFRIYPLAAAAVLTTYVLRLPSNAWSGLVYHPIYFVQLFSNLLLIQNLTRQASVLSVLWSLPLEIQMYVVLPFLFLIVRGPRWRFRLMLCAVVAVLAAALVWQTAGRLNILAFVPCFLAGVLAFKCADRQRTWPPWLWPTLILGVVFGLAFLPAYRKHFLHPVSIVLEWVAAGVLGLFWPMFREISWAPATRIAGFVAKYSYGIYLAHTFALYLAFVIIRTRAYLGLLLATSITIMVAVALYHLIEEPLIRLGKDLAAKIGSATLDNSETPAGVRVDAPSEAQS